MNFQIFNFIFLASMDPMALSKEFLEYLGEPRPYPLPLQAWRHLSTSPKLDCFYLDYLNIEHCEQKREI
jgi:hypothetical protein